MVAASKNVDDALLYMKWFAQPEVQQKWTDLGGASASKAVLQSDAYKNSAAYAPSFVELMGMVKDFWAEPLYVPLLLDMQNRVHDYVVADKGTSQEGARRTGQGLDQSLQAGRQGSFLTAHGQVRFLSEPVPGVASRRGDLMVHERAGS